MAVLFTLVSCLASGCRAKPMEIQVRLDSVFGLQAIAPSFEIRSFCLSPFAVDARENVYFVDQPNHRVLIFDSRGHFLKQLGSLGQGPEDLHSPFGIAVWNDLLIILNQEGREVKIFESSGRCQFGIIFPGTLAATSLCVNSNGIFTDTKTYHGSLYKEAPLIRHLSWEGKELAPFGEILRTSNFDGYAVFNQVSLAAGDGLVFGAFCNWPVIFAYDVQGRMVFRKDLRPLHITEMEEKKARAEKEGFDSPEGIVSKSGIRNIVYCSGVAVVDGRFLLYAIASRPYLLFFGLTGDFVGRATLLYQGYPIQPEYIYQSQDGSIFLIGKQNPGDYILFKIAFSID